MTTKRKPSRERLAVCQLCGNEFLTRHSQAKFCPGECRETSLRASWNKYGSINKERRLEYSRKHYQGNRDERLVQMANYRKTATGKDVIKKVHEKQRLLYPEKYRARQEVLKALRKGLLKKEPCVICGDLTVEAHHEDYSKPLNIKWLCKKHHDAISYGVYIEDGEVKN